MRSARRSLCVALPVAVLLSASTSFALDVCGETVPANRFIDGIPAYAQCAGSMSAAIYSDDGVNTATASAGSGWVRTQGSGGYQCTELAHRYLRFRFNVASVPNGNAGVWCDATLPAGLQKTPTPIHGDLIVLGPGSCGADATTGHVAVIDTVAADAASLMAVQQNGASRSRYNTTCAACFLHATANTGGSATDGGAVAVDAGAGDATVDATVPGSGGRRGSGGASGTAGSAGSGGSTATGGSPTSTATGGSAPSSGSGGMSMSAGTGGAVGSGGVPSVDAGAGIVDTGASGCACAVPGVPSGSLPLDPSLTATAAVALLIVLSRRRAPRRATPAGAAQHRRSRRRC